MIDIDEALTSLDPARRLPDPIIPTWVPPRQLARRPAGARRHRTSIALGLCGLVAAGTAAATYTLTSGPATNTESGGCYLTDSRTADLAVIDNDPTHPVAQCRAIWQQAFGMPPPVDLVTCLTPSYNSVAVFPGTDQASVCNSMGLRPWNGVYPTP